MVHRDLDADLRKNPDLYIASMKEEFRQAVDAYQLSNPWELPIELDIDELLQSMSLEQKIAQLFLFGIH